MRERHLLKDKINRRFSFEMATIKPGHSKVLNLKRKSGAVSYMPSLNSYSFQIKCKYKGKTYTVKNVHEGVNFYKKSGKKWKYIDFKGDYDNF